MPPSHLVDSYPNGTVQVPKKPADDMEWDGAQWLFVAPPAPPVRSLTPLAFIERFTEPEQLAIVTASMQVPAIKLWYDKLLSAGEVVQTDPRLIAGMAALVDAGLITTERSAEVLAWT